MTEVIQWEANVSDQQKKALEFLTFDRPQFHLFFK